MVLLSTPMALVMLMVVATMAQVVPLFPEFHPEAFSLTQASVDFSGPVTTPWTPTFPSVVPTNMATASSTATTQCRNNDYLCICQYNEAVKLYNEKCQSTLWGCGHKPRKEDYCRGPWLLAHGGDGTQKTVAIAYLYLIAALALLIFGYRY